MANYSFISGFELGHLGEVSSYTGTVSVQSTYKRTGGYALQVNPTTGDAYVSFTSIQSGGTQRSLFGAIRFYLRILSLPLANTIICNASWGAIYLGSDGKLSIGGSVWSTNSLTVDALFHKISVVETGAVTTLYVDGVSWCTNASSISSGTGITLGSYAGSTTVNLIFDDILITSDDNAGVDFPAGQVILLPPTSDNTDANWTAGAGGSSLYVAVDNIPPVGDATPTDTTQIKCAAKSTNDCILNVRSYTDGGIGASDTINAVMPICNHAEEIATGTKTGDIWISSNPTQSAGGNGTFDYGQDVGAMGDFPTNWKTNPGPCSSAPSVTKGTSPTVTIRKNENTTRVAHCDAIGVYVDYTPGATSQIKKFCGVTRAMLKKVEGVAIDQIKKLEGISNV